MLCLLVFFLRSDELQRVQQANTFRQRFIIIDRRIGRIVPCTFFRVDIPCNGRTAENQELGASALFENEKSRDSYGFTPQKSRQVSK